MLLLNYTLANIYEQKNFSKSLGKHFDVFRKSPLPLSTGTVLNSENLGKTSDELVAILSASASSTW